MARRTRNYWGQIDEDMYNELGNRATQEGLKITELINRYIVEGLQGDAGSDNSNLDSQIFLAVQKARIKERRIILLETLAATAIRHGDEKDLDGLAGLCSDASVSVEEIIERVKQQRQSHSLPSFDSGKGVRSAIKWLQDLFSDLDERRIGSREVIDMGANAGFTKATLEAAKPKLGIQSVREGMKWWWVMVEK